MENLQKRSIPAVLDTLADLSARPNAGVLHGRRHGGCRCHAVRLPRWRGLHRALQRQQSLGASPPQGDEIIMGIEGYTTLILLEDGVEVPIDLKA